MRKMKIQFSNTTMDIRKIARGVAFVLLFLALLFAMTTILKPKWYGDYVWEPATQIEDGFYSLDKNSTDVVFIGSSQVFCSMNTMSLWHDFGISSYDMTSSAQRVWMSDYYIDEVLKYQSPKVIALEVGMIFNDTPNDEDRNRKALDYMKLSPEKLDAIATTVRYSPEESFLSYLFPIMRFHTRWESLAKEDFQYFSSDKHYFLRGFTPYYDIKRIPVEEWMLSEADFFNDGHLNVDGANKVSRYFGNYLKSHYEFEDYSSDASWQRDYEEFVRYDAEKRKTRKEVE